VTQTETQIRRDRARYDLADPSSTLAPVDPDTDSGATAWSDSIPGGRVEWRGDETSTIRERQSGRRARVWRLLRRIAGPVALLVGWQLLSSSGAISTRTLPSPWQVLDTAWTLCANGTLPSDLGVSLRRGAEGLILGVLIGLTLGVVSGLWKLGEELFDSTIQMLRTVPFVALWPLLIVWFGIGETPKVVMVAFACSFPLYINTYLGIRNVDAKLIESARVVGLSTKSLVRNVVFPGALPQILVGLRLAIGLAVVALVVAESINATSGLGYMMQNAEQFVQTNVILVGLVVYALIGLCADLLVRVLERFLLPWRQSFSGR
jgi:sulfonate transport system permease protein